MPQRPRRLGRRRGSQRRGGVVMRHLILRLEAPLMAFGGETIDNYGVVRPFPAASMITGLLANALGWRRIERERHQQLQERLVFAARIDREPLDRLSMQDFQTAQLAKSDMGWTTRGVPEGRAGGANTYNAPHLRYRDYYADRRVTVALQLEPPDDCPTLDDLGEALQRPKRPLFIGRKPCLPSAPIFGCFAEGETSIGALLNTPITGWGNKNQRLRLQWPGSESDERVQSTNTHMITDQRNWISGLHGGGRLVCEGEYTPNEDQE